MDTVGGAAAGRLPQQSQPAASSGNPSGPAMRPQAPQLSLQELELIQRDVLARRQTMASLPASNVSTPNTLMWLHTNNFVFHSPSNLLQVSLAREADRQQTPGDLFKVFALHYFNDEN